MLKHKTDEELMLAYQLGDESAFAELYSRYSGKVLAFLKSRLKQDSHARDIFQGIFLKLHQNRHLYRLQFRFTPWLFTICKNEMIDTLRKENRNPLTHGDSIETTVNQDLVQPSQDNKESLSGISSLNQQQQVAIQMRYDQDSTFHEISKILKTTPSNARKIVSRSLVALKRFYEKK